MRDVYLFVDAVEGEIAKLYRSGNNYTLYVPQIIMSEVLNKPKQVFPVVANWDGREGLAFYFTPPENYELKPYKVYHIKKNGCMCSYIPIPKLLTRIVVGQKGRVLVKYSICKDGNNRNVIFLEKAS